MERLKPLWNPTTGKWPELTRFTVTSLSVRFPMFLIFCFWGYDWSSWGFARSSRAVTLHTYCLGLRCATWQTTPNFLTIIFGYLREAARMLRLALKMMYRLICWEDQMSLLWLYRSPIVPEVIAELVGMRCFLQPICSKASAARILTWHILVPLCHVFKSNLVAAGVGDTFFCKGYSFAWQVRKGCRTQLDRSARCEGTARHPWAIHGSAKRCWCWETQAHYAWLEITCS